MGDTAGQSHGITLSLLAVGVWLVLWTGYTSIKALVLVHATVWGVPAPPVRNPFRASLVFTGATFAFIASMVGVRWLRTEVDVLGFVVTLAVIVVPFAMWLVASRWLPHRAASWVELVPGALVVAVGVQALHLFTTLFLGPKLTSATELYGALGIATTILFWLYLVARFVIAGAILNASISERSGA